MAVGMRTFRKPRKGAAASVLVVSQKSKVGQPLLDVVDDAFNVHFSSSIATQLAAQQRCRFDGLCNRWWLTPRLPTTM